MSPQKFVTALPAEFAEEPPPAGFQFLKSIDEGFLAAFRESPCGYMQWKKYKPEHKIAVRLHDGRLVIPTVKGEKSA